MTQRDPAAAPAWRGAAGRLERYGLPAAVLLLAALWLVLLRLFVTILFLLVSVLGGAVLWRGLGRRSPPGRR